MRQRKIVREIVKYLLGWHKELHEVFESKSLTVTKKTIIQKNVFFY